MAKKKQSQSTDMVSDQATSQAAQGNQSASSNSMQLEKMRSAQKAEGVANYSSALGKYLGPQLYKAVESVLTESEMAGLASGAVESALNSLLDYIGEETGNAALNNDALMGQASKEIAQEIESLVEKWLGSESGAKLVSTLRTWVGANPHMVASLAALAAAAAIVTDMDIPTLKTKFGLSDGLTASLSANIGSFQNIALENIKAKLEYKGSNVSAAFEATHDATKGTSAAISGRLGSDERHLRGRVAFGEEGVTAFDMGRLYSFGKDTKLSAGIASTNGSEINKMNLGIKTKSGETTFSGNLNYDPSQGTLQGKYDQASKDGLKLGASLSGNTKNGEMSKFQTYAGHQKSGEFDSVMSKYTYDFQEESHNLNLMGQKQFGDFKLRGTQNFDYDNGAFSSSTEALGAYGVNDRLSVIGGAEYRHDQSGGRFLPKVGVQYDDVPIVMTFDPEQKSVSVGVTLKF
jgi:hypothetical protein